MHGPEQVFHHARNSGLVSDIAGSSFEEILTLFIVRSFSSDTIFPGIAEFVELNLNSFTLMLCFSEPTSLPVIVTSLTLQATLIGGTNNTLTGGSSAYDRSSHLL